MSGLGHFSDDDLSFFDLPKRAATPRGSEAPRSSRAAKTALAPLIVSPRNNGASVMFVDLPERFCFRKSISRAGLPGLRARGRGDDEQSPVGGDGVMERDRFSLALKLSLKPNWRTSSTLLWRRLVEMPFPVEWSMCLAPVKIAGHNV